MENNKYLVTGKFTRTGTGKTGQPYSIEELTVDFNGRAELCPVITEVISQEKKGDYNEQN